MNLKKLSTLGLTAALSLSMFGCGGSTNEQPAETGSKDEGPVTLEVGIWDSNQEPGIKEILAGFTEKTGIETNISVVKWDEYWTMLEAGAQGGSLPDVFWMHSNESQRYMSNDMLLDLTDRIANSEEIKIDNYPEDIWSLYTYDDKYYAVPKDIDTIALWYNKALFDEAGIDYPTADWTYDTLVETAKKLTKEDGSSYGFANRCDNNQAGYYNFVYSNNGYVINDDKTKSGWDDPKTIEGMDILNQLILDGSMPSAEVMAENNEDVLFGSGKIAMTMQGSWMVSGFKENEYIVENCDCAVLPTNANTGRRCSLYNGLGWVASANTAHPDAAWQCLEYLGSKDAQLQQAELGVTMSAYKNTSDDWSKSAPFNLKAYLEVMDDLVIRPFSRSTVKWENEDNDILKSVYLDELTMQEACEQMAEQMNEKLAEE